MEQPQDHGAVAFTVLQLPRQVSLVIPPHSMRIAFSFSALFCVPCNPVTLARPSWHAELTSLILSTDTISRGTPCTHSTMWASSASEVRPSILHVHSVSQNSLCILLYGLQTSASSGSSREAVMSLPAAAQLAAPIARTCIARLVHCQLYPMQRPSVLSELLP
jgi:hypothetical protein